MLEINGKTLITTDWHFGVSQNRVTKLKILTKVVGEINKYKKAHGIANIIFCGDMFHQRNNLSIETINIAIAAIEKLAEQCKIYLILGNHDIFNKNSNSINSMKIFKHIKNVNIIESFTECLINGNKSCLVPWNTDMTSIEKCKYDMMFGHFDISSRYLVESYIEDNIKRNITRKESIEKLNSDPFFSEIGMDDIDFSIENNTDEIVNSKSSSELLGDWIESVRERGTIFSGHIHIRKEFYTKNRKFIFIGSPYQQTLGEENSEDGFYTIDETNKIEFHILSNIPTHVDIKMSEIVKDIEGYDYSRVTGNIIHKIYDIEIDNVTESKITQKIIDHSPFEELPSDYSSTVTYTNENNVENSVDMIRKSKLDYIRGYINNMDKNAIENDGLDRDRLYSVMKEYYDMVNEEI